MQVSHGHGRGRSRGFNRWNPQHSRCICWWSLQQVWRISKLWWYQWLAKLKLYQWSLIGINAWSSNTCLVSVVSMGINDLYVRMASMTYFLTFLVKLVLCILILFASDKWIYRQATEPRVSYVCQYTSAGSKWHFLLHHNVLNRSNVTHTAS